MNKNDDYESRIRYGVAVNAAIQECIRDKDTNNFQQKVNVWHEKVKATWNHFEQNKKTKELKFFE